jgi:hypothetical protein
MTLTSSQERAVRHLVHLLEEAGACCQFSGGFAGNMHGSCWPLHDLDVDVARRFHITLDHGRQVIIRP